MLDETLHQLTTHDKNLSFTQLKQQIILVKFSKIDDVISDDVIIFRFLQIFLIALSIYYVYEFEIDWISHKVSDCFKSFL